MWTFLVLAACLLTSVSAASGQAGLTAQAQRGKAAMAAGEFDDAIEIYSELVRELPGDGGMRLNLGIALSMAGRLREALPHLERAVKLDPRATPGWLFLGSNRLELGEPDGAVAALQKVIAAEPGNMRARELLGAALGRIERHESAADQFRAITSAEPENARGWFGLGESYEALARRAFERLEAGPDGSPYAVLLRADVLAASGNPGGAIDLYRQVLGDHPALDSARDELVNLLARTGDDAGAAAERERLPRRPSCGEVTAAARRRADCEFRAGRYSEVTRLLKRSPTPESAYWLARAYNELARGAFGRLAALPLSPELHRFRARISRDRGRHVEAVEELRRALALAPGDAGLQQELATALLDAKDYDEAIPLLEGLASRTSSPDVLYLLGDALLISGRPGDALRPLQAAVASAGAFLPARASLGRAYVESGNARAAIPHLAAALAIDADGSLHYQLARAYQLTGQTALARQMLEKYAAMEKARRR